MPAVQAAQVPSCHARASPERHEGLTWLAASPGPGLDLLRHRAVLAAWPHKSRAKKALSNPTVSASTVPWLPRLRRNSACCHWRPLEQASRAAAFATKLGILCCAAKPGGGGPAPIARPCCNSSWRLQQASLLRQPWQWSPAPERVGPLLQKPDNAAFGEPDPSFDCIHRN